MSENQKEILYEYGFFSNSSKCFQSDFYKKSIKEIGALYKCYYIMKILHMFFIKKKFVLEKKGKLLLLTQEKKRNEDKLKILQKYQYIYKKGDNAFNITGTVDVDKNNFKIIFENCDTRQKEEKAFSLRFVPLEFSLEKENIELIADFIAEFNSIFSKIYNENDPLQVGGPNSGKPKEDKKEKTINIDKPYENYKH